MESPHYVVMKVLRKSKARYAAGINIGDTVTINTEIVDTTGGSGGRNYSLSFDLYVNGVYHTSMSQNEVPKFEEIFMLGTKHAG